MKNMICDKCGGTNVRRNADTAWNPVKQDWELVCVFDYATCEDCGTECSIREVPMNPNHFVGLPVIVSPKEDDIFPVYKGTIVGVREECFKVAEDSEDELSRYIYDVDHNQVTFL